MIKGVFLIDVTGDILVKYTCSIIKKEEVDMAIYSIRSSSTVPPFLESFGSFILFQKEDEIFVVCFCESGKYSLFSSQYLLNMISGIKIGINDSLTIESVKKNFPKIYEIIDQSLNNGFPFLDEPNVILGCLDSINDTLPIDYRYPWRTSIPQKGPQELYAEVIETMDLKNYYGDSNSFVSLRGSIYIHSKLDGIPICSISTTAPNQHDHVSYHRCVDPRQYISRRISFIPPNKDFCLMSYSTKMKVGNLPIMVVPKFSWSLTCMVFEIFLRIDSSLPNIFNDVVLSFSLPEGLFSASMASPSGKCFYDKEKRSIEWILSEVTSGQSYLLNGSASIGPGYQPDKNHIIVFIHFKAPGYIASGLKIDTIDVEDNTSKISKAIRYITKSGSYSFNVCIN